MKKRQRWSSLPAFLLIGQSLYANCLKPLESDEGFRQPPQIIITRDQLLSMQRDVYQSDLRLKNRFYQDDDKRYLSLYQDKIVNKPVHFFKTLSHHINHALKLGSAEAISYSDMGHVHLYRHQRNGTIKFLYHSGELFNFSKNGPWLRKRYLTRNMISRDKDLEIVVSNSGFNTVHTIAGHKRIETLYFTANKNGCFSYRYQGETFYYDVSYAKPRF